jgi:hypothetical protein
MRSGCGGNRCQRFAAKSAGPAAAEITRILLECSKTETGWLTGCDSRRM